MRTPEEVMKACQRGTTGYDSANSLHAECYGTIGKLLAERDELARRVAELESYVAHLEQRKQKASSGPAVFDFDVKDLCLKGRLDDRQIGVAISGFDTSRIPEDAEAIRMISSVTDMAIAAALDGAEPAMINGVKCLVVPIDRPLPKGPGTFEIGQSKLQLYPAKDAA